MNTIEYLRITSYTYLLRLRNFITEKNSKSSDKMILKKSFIFVAVCICCVVKCLLKVVVPRNLMLATMTVGVRPAITPAANTIIRPTPRPIWTQMATATWLSACRLLYLYILWSPHAWLSFSSLLARMCGRSVALLLIKILTGTSNRKLASDRHYVYSFLFSFASECYVKTIHESIFIVFSFIKKCVVFENIVLIL